MVMAMDMRCEREGGPHKSDESVSRDALIHTSSVTTAICHTTMTPSSQP